MMAAALGLVCLQMRAEPARTAATVYCQSLNAGAIDPKLFGNFIELLDDVVPGMWAEMLNDRSFEGVIPAANWCYYDGSPDICDRCWDTNATWSRVSEQPFNGAYCAKLSALAQPALLTQSGLSARKAMDYLFSGWLRADNGVQASVCLKCLLPTGDWMTLASARLPEPSRQWTKVSVQMTSAGQTDQAVFELRAQGRGNLWADKLSLMPADNCKGWRREVVEAVKAVRPAIIRWGGSSVDPGHYRWKEGIGEPDRRLPWTNRVWGRIDPNDVGMDEFCQFCELTGVEPLICVSFADGAENAGDLVEYCNADRRTAWGAKRAANGRDSPYHIKYWQIGNEISGNNEEYLRQLPAFIAAMKKADGSIQIMTSFPSQRLMDLVGKELAFVCPHHYTTDLGACDHELSQIADMLDHTPGCSGVRIGVTEWNIDADSWGLGRAAQATLHAALANARYLHLMMRHCDKVRIGCRSNLANSYCGALIETSPGGCGVLKRASYYVMELYSHRVLPRSLVIEQSSDRLDLFACGSEDMKSTVVFAVNPNPESVALSVAFSGFAGAYAISKAEAVCDTQNAGQPDVMNHWQTPERIHIVELPAAGQTVTVPPFSATALKYKSL